MILKLQLNYTWTKGEAGPPGKPPLVAGRFFHHLDYQQSWKYKEPVW